MKIIHYLMRTGRIYYPVVCQIMDTIRLAKVFSPEKPKLCGKMCLKCQRVLGV